MNCLNRKKTFLKTGSAKAVNEKIIFEPEDNM